MVKKAEKRKIRSPLLPVFGLIIGVGLFVVSFMLVNPLASLVHSKVPDFSLPGPDFSIGPTNPADPSSPIKVTMPSGPRIGMAIVLWLVLLAVTYTVVAIAVGKDPESAKDIKLPSRDVNKRR